MLTYRIAAGCEKAAALLRQLAPGAHGPGTGVVCWGVGYNGTEPALNARCGASNKLQQLQKFKDAGILVPPFWQTLPTAAENFPVLGRNLQHKAGRDIRLIMEPEMAA